MRRLIWPVLFLFLLLLQGSLSVFYTGWLAVDLPLLAIYSYALLRGENFGAFTGVCVGLLQDAMTVGFFGFHILSRGAVGYLVGLTKEKIFKEGTSYHMILIGLCSLLIRFCYLWLELIRADWHWDILPAFLWDTVGYCLGNMLLVVPMYHVVKKIYEWIKKEDISY